MNHGTEFGREAEEDRKAGGDHEEKRGIDAVGGHHADVFTVGRHTGAAYGTRDDRRDTVTQEGAAHVGVKVAARHSGDGFDVAQVFRNENDHHRHDEEDRIEVEFG